MAQTVPVQTKDVSFDEVMALASGIGLFDVMSAGEIYAFMLKISNQQEAQRVYQELKRAQEEHGRIDENFQKIAQKLLTDFDTSLTDLIVKSKRTHTEEKKEKQTAKDEKAAERLIESL